MHSAIISADMFFFRKFFAVSIAFLRSPAKRPFFSPFASPKAIPSLKPAFLAS